MEAAAILAFALRDWVDAAVIVAILILNAIVGWYQEKQISCLKPYAQTNKLTLHYAADVVASLKGDIAMKARVVRNGRELDIRARELVPGDIVSISVNTHPPTPPLQICWLAYGALD